MVCDDFNVNFLNVDKSPQVSKFLDSMYSNTLFPVIHRFNRVTTYFASQIENNFCNTTSILNSGVILTHLSNHFPVFTALDISYNTLTPFNDDTTECNLMRPLTSHGIKKFRTMLQLNSWDFITEQSNINNVYELLLLNFRQILNICLPQKIVKHRQFPSKLWMTCGLLISSHKKTELYKNYLADKIDLIYINLIKINSHY